MREHAPALDAPAGWAPLAAGFSCPGRAHGRTRRRAHGLCNAPHRREGTLTEKSTTAERVFALYRLDQTVERAPELLDAMRSAAASAFGEAGCVASRVFLDADEPGSLLLIEEWDSVAHLESHVLSQRFQRLLAVLELSLSRPDVAYVLGGEVRGIDWLASRLQPQK